MFSRSTFTKMTPRMLGLVLMVLVFVCWWLCLTTPASKYLEEHLGIHHKSHFVCNDYCSAFDYSFVIRNDDACSADSRPFLLFLVMSHHANVESRQAIRQTWGSVLQYRGYQIRTLFVFGTHPDKNFNEQIKLEMTKYRDIIQANFKDHFKTLTEKTMMSMQWVLNHCRTAKYIVKTDDDSFNHPHRYIDYLISHGSSTGSERFVGGLCFTVKPDTRKTSKYYVPPDVYPASSYFPIYCTGPAYIMSMQALKELYEAASKVKYVHLEDVYVTGFVRVATGIPYKQISGMVVGKDDITDCDLATEVLSSHRLSPPELRNLWKRAMKVMREQNCSIISLKSVLYVFILFTVWLFIAYIMIYRHKIISEPGKKQIL